MMFLWGNSGRSSGCQNLVLTRMAMGQSIRFPVFVCEIETGDVAIYFDINELRLIVEEFFDILEEDFIFWDRDGYKLKFDDSFLQGEDKTIRDLKSDEKYLVACLLRYADRNGINVENMDKASIMNISKSIWNH